MTGNEVKTDETEEVSLETALNQKLGQVYDDFNKVLTDRDRMTEQKENDLSHAFIMINQSLSALAAKLEAIEEALFASGTDKAAYKEAVKTKVEESIKKQEEIMMRMAEEQKAAYEAAMKAQDNSEAAS